MLHLHTFSINLRFLNKRGSLMKLWSFPHRLWEVARFNINILLLAGLSWSVQRWWSSLGDGDWQRTQERGRSPVSPWPRPPGLGRARPASCGRPPPPLPPHNFGRWVRIKRRNEAKQQCSLLWPGDPNGCPPPGNSGTQLASTGQSSTVVTVESGPGQVRTLSRRLIRSSQLHWGYEIRVSNHVNC